MRSSCAHEGPRSAQKQRTLTGALEWRRAYRASVLSLGLPLVAALLHIHQDGQSRIQLGAVLCQVLDHVEHGVARRFASAQEEVCCVAAHRCGEDVAKGCHTCIGTAEAGPRRNQLPPSLVVQALHALHDGCPLGARKLRMHIGGQLVHHLFKLLLQYLPLERLQPLLERLGVLLFGTVQLGLSGRIPS